MRIPKSITVAGIKIDVVFDNTLIDKQGTIGKCIYAEQKIILDPSKTPEETLEQAFIHEVVHWIFFIMGETELQNNEKIVDLFAHFAYQVMDTAKYE